MQLRTSTLTTPVVQGRSAVVGYSRNSRASVSCFGFALGKRMPGRRDAYDRSFMIELPRTIPLFGRRIGIECLDAPQQRHRRPVAGGHFKGRLEGAARFVPVSGAIGRQPFRIPGSHCQLLLVKLAFPPDDLKHLLGDSLTDATN